MKRPTQTQRKIVCRTRLLCLLSRDTLSPVVLFDLIMTLSVVFQWRRVGHYGSWVEFFYEVTSQNLWSQYDRHFVWCVQLNGEDLSCYSNKIEPVSLRKCPYDHWLTNKAYLSAITVTNIYRSFYLQDGGKNQLASICNKITSLSPDVYTLDTQADGHITDGTVCS